MNSFVSGVSPEWYQMDCVVQWETLTNVCPRLGTEGSPSWGHQGGAEGGTLVTCVGKGTEPAGLVLWAPCLLFVLYAVVQICLFVFNLSKAFALIKPFPQKSGIIPNCYL